MVAWRVWTETRRKLSGSPQSVTPQLPTSARFSRLSRVDQAQNRDGQIFIKYLITCYWEGNGYC